MADQPKWDPSRDYRKEPLHRAAAVRIKCMDCCGNDQGVARACAIYSCPLWPYGFAARYLRSKEKQGG